MSRLAMVHALRRSWWLIGLYAVAFSVHAQSVNVAARANGGVATASSSHSSGNYPPSAAIDGDRKGLNNGAGGTWNDGTVNVFPDWLQVNFPGARSISEIDVFTVQDNYTAPVEPTLTMTFTQYGATSFQVQYWNGTAWADVPGGNVTSNNRVWRRFTFSPISTDRIRVVVNDAPGHVYSCLTEVEAWSTISVGLNAPANNTMLAAPATVSLSATAADASSPLGKVEFYRDATLIATVTAPSSGTSSSGTYTAVDTNVAPGTYKYTAKAYDSANPGVVDTSPGVLVSVSAAGAGSVNVAAATNGGVATASSSHSSGNYPPSAAINGDRKGLNNGAGGVWNDGTANAFPDWLQVNFSSMRNIGEIDVFNVQDNYTAPVAPTPAMTFAQYGASAFQVQYWTGSAWADVPGGTVTGNNLVWRRFAFSPISTDRIRVVVTDAPDHVYARLDELEAWTVPAYQISGTVSWGGTPLAGAAFAGSGTSCSASNAQGQYACTVPPGWSGSVTASLDGYVLTPASRSYSGVQADQTAQDFAGVPVPVTIAGTVSSGSAPLAGIPVAASGGVTCTSSDAAGRYSCTAFHGWSGSVTPLGGYTFTPASRSYSGVPADQSAQDFAGMASTVSVYYIHTDHLNTPRIVSDPSGNEVWRWDNTEPFGDSVPNDDPSSTGNHFEFPLGLSGYYRDKESGNSYAEKRDTYDPSIGAFTQADPMGLAGGASGYAYVNGNPILYTDPTGELSIAACANPANAPACIAAGIIVGPVASSVVAGAVNALIQQQTNACIDTNELLDAMGDAALLGIVLGPAGGVRGILPRNVVPNSLKGIRSPLAGGGAKVDNLSSSDIARIQNAANRTRSSITVVGSRAAGTAGPNSDFDYVLQSGTPRNVRGSLPEGPRGLGEPRNQDFHPGPVDPTKPHITFFPRNP